MLEKIKGAFRRVSWWGFLSFILAMVAIGVMIFGTFEWAVFILGLAGYFVLVSFRDE